MRPSMPYILRSNCEEGKYDYSASLRVEFRWVSQKGLYNGTLDFPPVAILLSRNRLQISRLVHFKFFHF